MCPKLQLYVLRQLLVSLGMASAGIGFLVFPAVTVSAVHRVGVAGLEALALFVPMMALELLPFVLPMAWLLGVVAVYGRLSADHEWTATRMAGVHPGLLFLPGLGLAVVLSLGTGFAVHELGPEWKWRQRDFKRHAEVTLDALPPGQTELWLGNFYLHSWRREGSTFQRVLVYLPDAMSGTDLKVVAEEATFRFHPEHLEATFRGARVIRGSEESWSEHLTLMPRLDQLLGGAEKTRDRAKYFPTSELRAHLAAGSNFESPDIYSYEIHRRHALSWTYVLFLLLGAPTGLRLRRGSQLSAFAVATGFALLYYVFSLRMGKELALAGAVPAWLGAWSVNVAGGLIGWYLSWREVRR